MFLLTCDKKTN